MPILDNNPEEGRDVPQGQQYGRRAERDHTWTVYHVFTGEPADAGCGAMTGLSRSEATERMMSLNQHGPLRRGTRLWLKPPAMDAATLGENKK